MTCLALAYVMEHQKVTLGNACRHAESPSSQDSHLLLGGLQDTEEQETIGFTVNMRSGWQGSTLRVGRFTGFIPSRPRPQAVLRWRKKLRRGFTIARCKREKLDPTRFVLTTTSFPRERSSLLRGKGKSETDPHTGIPRLIGPAPKA